MSGGAQNWLSISYTNVVHLVYLVGLVSLVDPVGLVQPNKPTNGLRLNPIGFYGNQNRFS
jgi:hypothetical protein